MKTERTDATSHVHPADVFDHFEDALDGASAAAHKHVPKPGSLGGCRGGFDEFIEKDHRWPRPIGRSPFYVCRYALDPGRMASENAAQP